MTFVSFLSKMSHRLMSFQSIFVWEGLFTISTFISENKRYFQKYFGLCYAKRSLMAWVVVIPKERWERIPGLELTTFRSWGGSAVLSSKALTNYAIKTCYVLFNRRWLIEQTWVRSPRLRSRSEADALIKSRSWSRSFDFLKAQSWSRSFSFFKARSWSRSQSPGTS